MLKTLHYPAQDNVFHFRRIQLDMVHIGNLALELSGPHT
jgi:hypothetical protein